MDEITVAAETSRKTRAQLIDEFHGVLRHLIDGGVDESRKSEKRTTNSFYRIIDHETEDSNLEGQN